MILVCSLLKKYIIHLINKVVGSVVIPTTSLNQKPNGPKFRYKTDKQQLTNIISKDHFLMG